MTKLAPEWVRTSDPVIRSPARYRWTTAPAPTAPGDTPCASDVTLATSRPERIRRRPTHLDVYKVEY